MGNGEWGMGNGGMGEWGMGIGNSLFVIGYLLSVLCPSTTLRVRVNGPERSQQSTNYKLQITNYKLQILAANPKYRGVTVQKSASADGADFTVAEKATQGNVVEVSAE